MADDRSLGERELDVMTVLWATGSRNRRRSPPRLLGAKLAYTTVLTILRNLEAKKFLRHEEEGRAHRYFPRVQQGSAQKSALARLIDTLFHGSPEALIPYTPGSWTTTTSRPPNFRNWPPNSTSAADAARGHDDPHMDGGGHGQVRRCSLARPRTPRNRPRAFSPGRGARRGSPRSVSASCGQ